MPKVLTAVSEQSSRKLICSFLESAGYEIISADGFEEAVTLACENPISAAVIDQDISPLGVQDTVRTLRSVSPKAAVILLTASPDGQDDATADASLRKPFSLACLKVLLSELSSDDDSDSPLSSQSSVRLDRTASCVYIGDRKFPLTAREFDILELLNDHVGEIFTREMLLNRIWGKEYSGDCRTVDSHIARLRAKLGDWGMRYLKTVYGSGYRLDRDPV